MKKKITRWLLYIALILLAVLVILYFAIQTSFVQNYAKDKILASLSERYEADWNIGDIKIDFFDEIVATDILFLDQQKDTLLAADRLLVDISLFSLLGKEINIDEIVVQGLRSKIYQMDSKGMNFDFLKTESKAVSDRASKTESQDAWLFSIDQVNLIMPSIHYQTSTKRIGVELNDLVIDIDALDFNKQKIDLSLLQLVQGNVDIESLESNPSDDPFALPELGWNIQLDVLDVNEVNVNMISDNSIVISEISIDATDVVYDTNGIKLDVEQIKGIVDDQITIDNISGVVSLKESNLKVSNLSVDTNRDRLRAETINYNINSQRLAVEKLKTNVSSLSLSQLSHYIPKDIHLLKNTNINLQVNSLVFSGDKLVTQGIVLSYGDAFNLRSNITLDNLRGKDIKAAGSITKLTAELSLIDRMFTRFSIPDSWSQFRHLELSGNVDGSLSQLDVNRLDIKLDDVFSTNISGILKHLNDIDRLQFDIELQDLIADVQQLPLPLYESIALDSLGKIEFDGRVEGNLNAMTVGGSFRSNLGSLVTDIALSNLDDLDNLVYKGHLSMNKFDLGTLLRNPDLNRITITTELDGKGTDFNKMNSKINGRVSDFVFNGYDYADVDVDAKISDSAINGKLSIDDKNVKLSYDGMISFLDGQSIYKFEADIDTLNLKALGFYYKEVSLSGKLISDFKLPLSQDSDGALDIYQLRISNPNESFFEDSIQLMAVKILDSTFVDIRSDFMNVDVDGKYSIRDLPQDFLALANYYMLLDTSLVIKEQLSQSAHIKGQLKTLLPLDILMVDKLVQARNISFDMNFDFESHRAEGRMVADSLYYGKYFSERMTLDMSNQSDVLAIDVLGENNIANGIEVPTLSMDNELRNRKLYSTVLASDHYGLPKLKFSTVIENTDEALQLSLQDSLVLNQKDWVANDNNLIKISKGKININELSLTDQNEYLKIYSIDDDGNDLSIDFKNFNLGQFTTLLTSKSSKLSGNINGEIEIRDMAKDMYYLINAVVDDIVYDSTSVGALTLKASDDPSSNVVTADVRLKGPQNDLSGKGTYNTSSKSADFVLDIDHFQFMLLDPFLEKIIKDSEGSLSGNVSIKGTVDDPLIGGSVTLDKVITTIVVSNSRYAIDKHMVTFDNEAIDIGVVDLYDANNNTATLSGKIYHDFLDDILLDLHVDTDKFVFLNTTKSDNPIFYGKLVLDANGTIVGPMTLLDVNLNARTLENTVVTLSPLSGNSFAVEEKFITYGKPNQFEGQTSEYLLKLARAFPFKVNLLLNATDDATINFVVDPITGDRIEGAGKGDLRIKLNPDGRQEIYGVYTVNVGSYKFSYGDFLTKKFKIKPGGTVKFNGNPLGAILDIDAIYNVYTTTYELIKNEVSDVREISAAQKRTNVEVYLNLAGSLSSPKINLDLQIPDLQGSTLVSSIDRKLNDLRSDPNEMNSQVFGLLLFDGFILSDNASVGFGSIGSNLALSSVSNLISSQLNKFADKAIKGVDVNVNVNSYESDYVNGGEGGNVTEIGLEVSKRLFDDRFSITAGGNLGLTDSGGEESYSSFIGDFVLEYKLSENGNYRVRVFSKSNFDRIAEENTNKNGVSLFFNKTFDSKTESKH